MIPLHTTEATVQDTTLPLGTRPAVASTLPPAASAVSWGAILAGAAGAAALSMILLILGTGLGLSSVSPWAGEGAGAAAIGWSTILWLTFTQLAASGLGGYLAGRLRTRWASTAGDEVYFRDTAHGFLSWAVASLVTAALLTSTIGAIVSGGAQVASAGASAATATAAAAVPAAAAAGADQDEVSYFVDTLFRPATPGAPAAANAPAAPDAAASAVSPDTSAPAAAAPAPALTSAPDAAAQAGTAVPSPEVVRILARASAAGSLPATDATYLGQLVSQRTGLPPAEANRRVTEAFAQMQAKVQEAETAARDTADKARKAAAYAALWFFVSLLGGAFVASWLATYGGRQRDLV